MIHVRVPATTANLGAGFDCLGLALTLYNEVEAQPADDLSIIIEGEGAAELPRDETNLVWRAARRVLARVGDGPPGVRLHLRNRIPMESGLGSSAAATVAGLLVGHALTGQVLSQAELLEMAVAMEGHPDNVAPALLGGLMVAARDDDGRLLTSRVAIPPWHAVAVMPDFRLSTQAARRALPDCVSLSDAVYNVGHAALTVVALQQGDVRLLAAAMTDRLHQPYRAPLVPGLQAALDAVRAQGVAAAISGSGPTVIAFVADQGAAVGEVVVRAFARVGLAARVWELTVAEGAEVRAG